MTALLLVGAVLAGLVVPGLASPATSQTAGQSQRPYLHIHSDGHLWRHDPSTGEAADLGIQGSAPVAPLAGSPFSFGAAGDYGFSGDTQAVMSAMGNSGLDFVLVLGDMSYGSTSAQNWCNFFESKMGDGKVILITGNHDTGEIDTFRQYCNFGITATLTGDYGKEYYFDYPQTDSLVRIVGTSCGTLWSCSVGNSHYNFVSNAIDGARNSGIPWVVVFMHKNCISVGSKDCAIGEAFQDLLLSKRVDLVLQGHDHNYQRSHQLTCADDNVFHAECIADTDDDHVHGAGEVLNIAGTGGQGTYSTGGTADDQYFSKWSSSTKGFLKVDVSEAAMDVAFQNVVGGFTDAYHVVRTSSGPDFSLSASPASVSLSAGQSAVSIVSVKATGGFTGTVALTAASAPSGVTTTCVPSNISGSQTSTCTLSSSTAGTYTVTITGTSGTLVRTASIAAAVARAGPTARFTYSPVLPNVNETITFDASSSSDTDPSTTLQARWDWESDGSWDTPYVSSLTAENTYATAGARTVTLEILDSHGFTDRASAVVSVLATGGGGVSAGAPPGYGLTDPGRLEARAPIYIGSNAAFTAANGVRRGTGTAADPYVISDWFIDGSLYPGSQAMIHIEFTDQYVVVENNKIVNLTNSNHWEGIQLGHWPATVSTQHVTIRHNAIENARHAYGIAVREGSRDVRVEANYVQLDANYEWVYGIMTDRGVHDVTIEGNYVNAYTSGTFHTAGIHLSDTHVSDARRATGLVATRNTVVNATAAAIESNSSSDTVIAWNLLYMEYPGIKSVGAGLPYGIATSWNSSGTVVAENLIHTLASGILVGSNDGVISSNTIFEVDYGIFVPDDGMLPGVESTSGTAIFNTTMWEVAQGTIRLPNPFDGTVVDLGSGIRPDDLTPVLFMTDQAASQVAVSWSGTTVNLSAVVQGTLVFDTGEAAESQSVQAAWTGSITRLGLTALSPTRVSFHLESAGNVLVEAKGLASNVAFRLVRTNLGGTSEILSVQSTAAGEVTMTVPAAESSDYVLSTEGAQDTTPGLPGLPALPGLPELSLFLRSMPFLLTLLGLVPLVLSILLVRRRHRRKRIRRSAKAGPRQTRPRQREPHEGDTRKW